MNNHNATSPALTTPTTTQKVLRYTQYTVLFSSSLQARLSASQPACQPASQSIFFPLKWRTNFLPIDHPQ